MTMLITIILIMVEALLCGYLCSKCQPRYKFLDGSGAPEPSEHDVKDILCSYKRNKIADAVDSIENIHLIKQNNFAYINYIFCFEAISKVPVGYALSAINVAALCYFEKAGPIVIAIAVVANIATHWFFTTRNTYAETKSATYNDIPTYNIDTFESNISTVNDILNTTGPAVKYRVETLRKLFKEANQYRMLYCYLTAGFAIINII